MATQKVNMFTGATDVKMFLTKCELHCKLKGYEDEKIAVFIAERLDEAAFDTYMTLTTEDKKDPEKIKDALLNGFDRSKRNREVAVEKLKDRGRLPNEGAEVFAYKIKELVKSAYPKFNDDALALLTKDYYVKGLHIDIQKELRKHEAYEDKSVDDLVTQTILLEIARKNSSRVPEETIRSIKEWTSLEAKMDRLLSVCEKSFLPKDNQEENISYAGASNTYYKRNRQRSRGQRNYNFTGKLECRICNGTDHLFRQCPSRYCQACGKKGHDGWEKTCPKYK